MAKMNSKQVRRPTVGRFIRPAADLDRWAVEEAQKRGMKNMQELLIRLLWEERQRQETGPALTNPASPGLAAIEELMHVDEGTVGEQADCERSRETIDRV